MWFDLYDYMSNVLCGRDIYDYMSNVLCGLISMII